MTFTGLCSHVSEIFQINTGHDINKTYPCFVSRKSLCLVVAISILCFWCGRCLFISQNSNNVLESQLPAPVCESYLVYHHDVEQKFWSLIATGCCSWNKAERKLRTPFKHIVSTVTICSHWSIVHVEICIRNPAVLLCLSKDFKMIIVHCTNACLSVFSVNSDTFLIFCYYSTFRWITYFCASQLGTSEFCGLQIVSCFLLQEPRYP